MNPRLIPVDSEMSEIQKDSLCVLTNDRLIFHAKESEAVPVHTKGFGDRSVCQLPCVHINSLCESGI